MLDPPMFQTVRTDPALLLPLRHCLLPLIRVYKLLGWLALLPFPLH